MTPNHSSPADGYDREMFQNDLAALIDQARDADVDIRGGYDMPATDEHSPGYTVEITELAPSSRRT